MDGIRADYVLCWRRLFLGTLGLAVAGAVVAASTAWGATWYVRTGSSGGNGTIDLPYSKIATAISAAAAGDTIRVAEGGRKR